VQAVGFDTELLIAFGRRAVEAAGAGALTFAVPELAMVAETIARDERVEQSRATAQRWRMEGAEYHALVRLCACYVMELEAITPTPEPVYVPKACDELEPLLALWPYVLALPMTNTLCARDLLRLRAFPVHPLGVNSAAAWADGRRCSPAEFFFHDLDHARFKVREDLQTIEVAISDAYQHGTTFDSTTGRHRSILSEAAGKVGPAFWSTSTMRLSLIERVLAQIDALADHSLAGAAEWLLFQILHEKSVTLDVATLRQELATSRHVELLRTKVNHGFYGENAPSTEVMARLDAARAWLTEILS
jgi:hypothetical protein